MKLQELQRLADSLHIDAIGVAPVALLSAAGEYLRQAIERGDTGEMGYLERNMEKRVDITRLVEGAQSVVVVLINYKSNDQLRDKRIKVASYAYGEDYHKIVKDKLFELSAKLKDYFPDLAGRCFVDSAPVFEHEWARRAGLGWIGNNTLLINKELGSYTFIGCFVSNAIFEEYSEPFVDDFCGRCNKCVEACPTHAIHKTGVDARKCLSYNTIELRGEMPDEIRDRQQGWIYGCDICQQVCPWNSKSPIHSHNAFHILPILQELSMEQWLEMETSEFEESFKNSAMCRAGLQKIQNNISAEMDNPYM
ncbi:MAG: tRNA epoxyqueuosine(34) reductase QueG [Marinifilaceae bacterium]